MTMPLNGLAFNAYCRCLGFKKDPGTDCIDPPSPPNCHLRGNRGDRNVLYPSEKMQSIINAVRSSFHGF
jgi:hypothetical protein